MKKILKKVKIRHLIMLIFLLMFNSFAWFIYATQVSNGVNAHVRSWKIMFKSGEQEISNYISIDIDDIKPGMETFVKEIKVYNMSEVSSTLSYEILSARILSDEVISAEGKLDKNLTLNGDEITSKELTDELKTKYPFKIDISITSTLINPEVGESTYRIEVSWPYESGDDDVDTLWGGRAYNYQLNNPSKSSINLNIKLVAIQTD